MIEELVLADGRKINTQTGEVVKATARFVEIPTVSEAQKEITVVRKKLSDLPTVPDQANTLGIVLAYSLFGLSDAEIGIALKLTEAQISRIKMLHEYGQLHKDVVSQVMAQAKQDVRGMFDEYSKMAAKTIGELMVYGENEAIKLNAAKDILDRAGHRPADMIIENRQKNEQELTVVFVKQDQSVEQVPVIDLKEVDDNGVQGS